MPPFDLRREKAVHHPAHFQMLGAVVLDELIGLVILDVLVEAQIRLVDVGYGGLGSFLNTADENSS